MDLGATVCRPRAAALPALPVAGRPAPAMPPASPSSCRGGRRARRARCGAASPSCWRGRTARSCSAAGRAEGLLGGLHELPSSPWREGELALEAALAHAPAAAPWRLHAAPVRHVFSHFVLELTLAEATAARGAGRPLVPAGASSTAWRCRA